MAPTRALEEASAAARHRQAYQNVAAVVLYRQGSYYPSRSMWSGFSRGGCKSPSRRRGPRLASHCFLVSPSQSQASDGNRAILRGRAAR